jgi:hypothetical protein
LATQLAFERTSLKGLNSRPEASTDESNRSNTLDFFAQSHAFAAEYAPRLIPLDERGGLTRLGFLPLERDRFAKSSKGIDRVLEATISGPLANGAVKSMEGGQHFELNAARTQHLWRRGLDEHAFLNRCRTSWDKAGPPVTSGDDAEPATPKRCEARIEAQRRNVNGVTPKHLKKGLSRTRRNLHAVDRDPDLVVVHESTT